MPKSVPHFGIPYVERKIWTLFKIGDFKVLSIGVNLEAGDTSLCYKHFEVRSKGTF